MIRFVERNLMGIQTRFLAKTWFVRIYQNSLDRTVEATEIDYLIGGAVAVMAWGESRTTHDLDLVINLPGTSIVQLSYLSSIPFLHRLYRSGGCVAPITPRANVDFGPTRKACDL